ncbi:MAG: 30S ribosomal protein S7 [Candidatus Aenigmarchaeota archaeon]|nr:30S ribosomal protein S7 [Candidatus Aenigmarchaeota archaeon]
MDPKLFGKWDYNVEVEDLGLRTYINIEPKILPKSDGKTTDKQIVERLITHLMVPGHKGKKHRYTSGLCSGKYQTIYKLVEDAFDIISEKTKKNPIAVLIKALENASPYELTVSQQIGGIVARKPALCSPKKRLDLALRKLVQGSYAKTFNKKKKMSVILAEELIAASQNKDESYAIAERKRNEKEAEGAR